MLQRTYLYSNVVSAGLEIKIYSQYHCQILIKFSFSLTLPRDFYKNWIDACKCNECIKNEIPKFACLVVWVYISPNNPSNGDSRKLTFSLEKRHNKKVRSNQTNGGDVICIQMTIQIDGDVIIVMPSYGSRKTTCCQGVL